MDAGRGVAAELRAQVHDAAASVHVPHLVLHAVEGADYVDAQAARHVLDWERGYGPDTGHHLGLAEVIWFFSFQLVALHSMCVLTGHIGCLVELAELFHGRLDPVLHLL